jgi:hypothetical protein
MPWCQPAKLQPLQQAVCLKLRAQYIWNHRRTNLKKEHLASLNINKLQDYLIIQVCELRLNLVRATFPKIILVQMSFYIAATAKNSKRKQNTF